MGTGIIRHRGKIAGVLKTAVSSGKSGGIRLFPDISILLPRKGDFRAGYLRYAK